jgi:RNA recognition motif-containing protein
LITEGKKNCKSQVDVRDAGEEQELVEEEEEEEEEEELIEDDIREGELDDDNMSGPDDMSEPEDEDEEDDQKEQHEVLKEHRKRKEFEVFVGGLDKDATESDIRKAFAEAGELKEIRLLTNPITKKNKGFAFLRFATVEQARRVVSEFKNPLVCSLFCLFIIVKSWIKNFMF